MPDKMYSSPTDARGAAQNLTCLEKPHAAAGAVAALFSPGKSGNAQDTRSPIPVLYAHWGDDWIRGSERCLLDLVAHLDRTRWSPVVLCNSPVLGSAASAIGIPVIGGARLPTEDAFLPEWKTVVEARRIVRHHRIRLIHVNNMDLVKWLLPAARTGRVPILAHVHLPSTRVDRCYAWAHQVARVVAVGRGVAQDFLDDGLAPERVSVIYNAVDPERLGTGDATALRGELGIRTDTVVIVAVASLIPRKGFDLLLRAFARVLRDRTGARLLIVGDGPDRSSLEALARDLGLSNSVRFLGERPDAGAIFRDACDVAASAARQETFGLTLLEAALFGCPVAATDIPPHREAVVDGETGLLAAAEDPLALAAVLTRLIDDVALRRRLGDAGRARVHKEFLVGRYVRQFADTYEDLLSHGPHEYGWLGRWAWPAAYSQWTRGAIRRRLLGKT